MEMLIAILLWLQCITAPHTYTVQQIDGYATTNAQVITAVYNAPPLCADIWQVYGPVVPMVDVIDP